jgi:hypothetical protein
MQRNPQSSGRERVRGGQRLDLKGTRLDEHAPVGARGAPRNHVLSASDASRPEPDTTWSPRRGACAPGQKHHVGAPRADFCTRACARSGPSRELATLKRLVARPPKPPTEGRTWPTERPRRPQVLLPGPRLEHRRPLTECSRHAAHPSSPRGASIRSSFLQTTRRPTSPCAASGQRGNLGTVKPPPPPPTQRRQAAQAHRGAPGGQARR